MRTRVESAPGPRPVRPRLVRARPRRDTPPSFHVYLHAARISKAGTPAVCITPAIVAAGLTLATACGAASRVGVTQAPRHADGRSAEAQARVRSVACGLLKRTLAAGLPSGAARAAALPVRVAVSVGAAAQVATRFSREATRYAPTVNAHGAGVGTAGPLRIDATHRTVEAVHQPFGRHPRRTQLPESAALSAARAVTDLQPLAATIALGDALAFDAAPRAGGEPDAAGCRTREGADAGRPGVGRPGGSVMKSRVGSARVRDARAILRHRSFLLREPRVARR
jgi:hypothetical protein